MINVEAHTSGRFDRFRCLRLLLAALVFAKLSIGAAGPTVVLAHLPNCTVNAAKVDTAGNIYIAGFQGSSAVSDSTDAFVAKLGADGTLIYSTKIGGSKADYAAALDVDPTGAAYILGQTGSSDFPTTSGAIQSGLSGASEQGFVAKIDGQGRIIYATLFGAGSEITPSAGGLLVDSMGSAVVSGQTIGGTFPAFGGAPFTSADTNTFFVARLDAAGANLIAGVRGIGGRLASEGQGNIYIAGIQLSTPTKIPVTPGAFQTTHTVNPCNGTVQLAMSCSYQYLVKLNSSLTQIVYATYVTGSWGASPSAIATDALGNVLLAGTTNSPDYPATPDAFEPLYIANAPPTPQTCIIVCITAPPASGYFTKVNATGTGILYSTFLSGTQSDTVSFAALASQGIYLSGQASSDDFPALVGIPSECLPAPYETRLTLDGESLAAARLVPGAVLAYDSGTMTLIAWTGTDLVRFDPTAPPPPITCILDSADLRPVTAIAPGELISLYGPLFLNGSPVAASGSYPKSLAGVTVSFNDIAGPLLYVSGQQINVQVPYEIAGAAQVNLTLASASFNQADSATLAVTPSNPVAFLEAGEPNLAGCSFSGQSYNGEPILLALNGDGSLNSCANPARAGSTVTIFLEGLGITVPSPVTGAVNGNPGIGLNLTVTSTTAKIVAASALPGALSGVWEVSMTLPGNPTGAVAISLSVNSVPVRDGALVIWAH